MVKVSYFYQNRIERIDDMYKYVLQQIDRIGSLSLIIMIDLTLYNLFIDDRYIIHLL